MTCPYFTSTGGNLCRKSDTYQSEATKDQYCTTSSDWSNCPNYTGNSSCFLTTACVHYAGLPDDCAELTGMRKFRDEYLLSLPNGRAAIDEYYRLAPDIVKAIEHSTECAHVLSDILTQVRQCVRFVDAENNEAALEIYTSMFDNLKNKMVYDTCHESDALF